jgi:hypothetical protein
MNIILELTTRRFQQKGGGLTRGMIIVLVMTYRDRYQ